MVSIEIDPGAGFCFGVEQVIHTAESYLKAGKDLYGLGAMVHNQEEVDRLESLGLKTLSHRELETVRPEHLLIRAHGEPPSTYRLAEKYQIQVIDGTCPIVEKLQTKIRRVYDSMDHEKEQLVIFGISDHPETIGLLGHVNQHALVVSTLDDLRKVDPAKRVHLFSQTTMDPEAFREIEEGLREYLQEHESPSFHSACTICGQMKKRKPYLAKFAQTHDLILFVSGKSSSNGKMLFEYSRSINPSTFWISNPGEINPVWLEGASSIGVSGATSTSREQLEAIVEHLHNMG